MTWGSGRTTGGTGEAVDEPLLDVSDLCVEFRTPGGALHAVKGLSYQVNRGEAIGIVGESGSGKSVGVLAIAGLLGKSTATVSGRVTFEGRDLLSVGPDELRKVRGRRIGFVFQDPLSSLNPVLTVGYQVMESMRLHLGTPKAQARRRAVELLELVGIPEPHRRLGQYPHEFSGGMRQRVMIAAALATEPSLLIADEPTTALDVTVQAQVLDLLRRLQKELGMSTILISHDLGVVAGLVDRVMVMYAGRPVEVGPIDDVLPHPYHPYTQGLLRSIPRLDERRGIRLEGIPGRLPDPTIVDAGCEFRERCSHAFERCTSERPPLTSMGGNRHSACWLAPSLAAEPGNRL